jgi:hypothetical protein
MPRNKDHHGGVTAVYEVYVDAVTTIAPGAVGFVLRQVDDARKPGRVRESAGAYADRVGALRSLVLGEVRWGAWLRLGGK